MGAVSVLRKPRLFFFIVLTPSSHRRLLTRAKVGILELLAGGIPAGCAWHLIVSLSLRSNLCVIFVERTTVYLCDARFAINNNT